MRTSCKKWAFTMLLIALPVLLTLVVTEALLKAVGFGYPTTPLIRMEVDGEAYWVTNPDFTRLFFPEHLKRLSPPDRFPVEKAAGSRRYLVVGGSAVAGDPDTDFSIARNLEWILQTLEPDAPVKVINLAYTACNSHVAREVVLQSEPYQLDGILVLVGNNEVIGPFGPGTSLTRTSVSQLQRRLQVGLRKSKLGQLGQRLRASLGGDGDVTPWQGMGHFLDHRLANGDPRLESVYAHFQANLEAIGSFARERGIPVVLSTVPVNLLDQPPFFDDLGALSDELRTEVLHFLETGESRLARSGWLAAAEMYPHSAYIHYIAGNLLMAAGEPTQADVHLQLARDLDQLRFRADSRIQQIIRQQWERQDLPWLPLEAEQPLIEDHPRAALGFPHFYEHVHFSFRANFLIAKAMARKLLQAEAGTIARLDALTWEQAASALAYTPYEIWNILTEIEQRIGQSPFREIPGYAEKTAWMSKLREQLLEHISKAEVKAGMQATYLAAIRARPEDDRLQIKYALFLAASGWTDNAYPILRDAFHRNPTDGNLAITHFQLSVDMDQRDEAQAALERIESIFPSHPHRAAMRQQLSRMGEEE